MAAATQISKQVDTSKVSNDNHLSSATSPTQHNADLAVASAELKASVLKAFAAGVGNPALVALSTTEFSHDSRSTSPFNTLSLT